MIAHTSIGSCANVSFPILPPYHERHFLFAPNFAVLELAEASLKQTTPPRFRPESSQCFLLESERGTARSAQPNFDNDQVLNSALISVATAGVLVEHEACPASSQSQFLTGGAGRSCVCARPYLIKPPRLLTRCSSRQRPWPWPPRSTSGADQPGENLDPTHRLRQHIVTRHYQHSKPSRQRGLQPQYRIRRA